MAVVAAAALVSLQTGADAAPMTTVLTPGTLTTTAGRTGGQAVGALAAQDQSGTADSWSKYVEFGGKQAGAPYSGYAQYTVPGSVQPASVTSLTVTTNYRGPATNTQTWGFDVYNYSTAAWVRVGTNAGAPDWGSWKALAFTAPGTASQYVSGAGAVRVRLTSSNAADDADVDYLAVSVTSDSTPVTTTTAPTTSTAPSTTKPSTTAPSTTAPSTTKPSTTAPSTTAPTTTKPSTTAPSTTAPSTTAPSTTAPSGVTLPPANGVYDYQINGIYTPAAAVSIVGRDRTETPAAGKYNVCYINAFQTQPEEKALWAGLILKNGATEVFDPDWKDEFLLDTSTQAKRDAIGAILGPWMESCASKGFKAVEADNFDSWTRAPKQLITQDSNVAMAKWLVAKAHSLGLAIGQKNASEVTSIGKSQIGFDFAVAEECQVYNECGAFTTAYGNQVYEVEYDDNGGLANFNAACAANGAKIAITYRDRQVVPPTDGAYKFQYC